MTHYALYFVDEHLLKDVRVKVERATADNYVKRAKISSTWLIGKIPRTPPGLY